MESIDYVGGKYKGWMRVVFFRIDLLDYILVHPQLLSSFLVPHWTVMLNIMVG